MFRVDLGTKGEYLLYSINWSVFITGKQCVYCAVQTGTLNKIQDNFRFLTADIEQALL